MESERMIIEEFGPRVTSVWNDLRSTTRSLLERAWRSSAKAKTAQTQSLSFDPRADQELGQLLAALDERAREAGDGDAGRRARQLADACAELLAEQTQSGEVFANLIKRAHERRDFAQVDSLTEALTRRLAPSEICELARSVNVVVRALAHEALTQMPTATLIALLSDPVDSAVARFALHRQATEYNSLEAQQALQDFDRFGLEEF